MTTTTDHLRVGMRFARHDVQLLSALAQRAESRDLKESAIVFRHAAEAARTGEPLIVECTSVLEAKLMAVGYTRYGVTLPTLHGLSGAGH